MSHAPPVGGPRERLSAPRLSVVMPVYNGEKYVCEAVESILAQTYREFELVIVDDGSTDRTRALVRSYDDPRIRRIECPDNRGLVAALNHGVAESHCDLIARQDADDVSEPTRLELQVAFLDENPNVALVGSSFALIAPDGAVLGTEFTPVRDLDVRREILVRNPFGHGSVVVRKAAFHQAGGYRGDFRHNEDLDLWRRIVAGHEVANLPDVLYRWRVHPDGITERNRALQERESNRIFAALRREPISPPVTSGEILAGSRYYRELEGRSQPGRHRQYLAARFRLALALIRYGRLDTGLRMVLAGIVADPRVALHSSARALKRSLGTLRGHGAKLPSP